MSDGIHCYTMGPDAPGDARCWHCGIRIGDGVVVITPAGGVSGRVLRRYPASDSVHEGHCWLIELEDGTTVVRYASEMSITDRFYGAGENETFATMMRRRRAC